ncbi:MAG TPA: M1 family aminopeptidase [Saprospiraceae bacterium]|nr:M1 family aminopeptidase [Saprospiraceae bacterium]
MWKFIKHEWKYWLNAPMTWIFLLINTMLVMGAVSSDNINIGGGVGSVFKNAPSVVQKYYGVMSLLCLLMTTAFLNATANRDFEHGMYQFIFTSPIKKRDYYFGKFIGATSIAMLPLLGVSIGALIGPFMPWAQAERYGDIVWSGHLQGIVAFAIPNTMIAASLIYLLAILFRSNMVSFIGSMLILILYVVSSGFTEDIQKEWLANLIDPFGFRPESIASKYMTVDEKNHAAAPLQGAFLLNRIIWVSISVLVLILSYFKFSFSAKKQKVKKESKASLTSLIPTTQYQKFTQNSSTKFSWTQFFHLLKFETKSIIKNPTFIIIAILGLMNMSASLTSFTGRYGGSQYPVTYDVIDAIRGSFYLFLIGIITFYTGVLVWKERDAKVNEIQDATPVQSLNLFLPKLLAMIIALACVLSTTILVGVIAQTFLGYHRYELDVYFKSLLLIDLSSFSFLVVIALLFHYLINNRYIAYFAFVAFIILNQFIWQLFQINTNMLKFGSTPSITYSDMNGFGPFVPSTLWFTLYWIIFSILLCICIYAFFVRGKETNFSHRWNVAKSIFSKQKLAVLFSIIGFISCAGFVYYNTKVLNTYDSEKVQEQKQVSYEKKYKQYQNLIQPRFYKFDYNINIFPKERSLTANVIAYAHNPSNQSIRELHFTMPQIPDSVTILIENAILQSDDTELDYRIYSLANELKPGDSLKIEFKVSRITKGFENEVSFTQLTQNGSFFNNSEILPSFGYDERVEISDKNKRKKFDLPKRFKMPLLDDNDLATRKNNYITDDADWVEVNTTISTSSDQIAIAPGSLIKTWDESGRNYFQYKLDHKSLNFYSFISANFEVERKKWNGVDLEVYYIKEHKYNVPNMIKSLEKSLEYYTTNFGPYRHKQCRIIEFPRYSSFAQAFPGTMPYSEGIGFIADLREVTTDDIDQVYYVVAHEMGHQYWAHQLCGANMQGSELMSEGFAQYSALMVMEKEYGEEKMQKFLEYEMDGYLRGRSTEFEAERPLMKSEHQGYIHYQKASVILYYLKEMIGEQKVNEALKGLIDTFGYKEPPYPSSIAAIDAFRKVTPDSLQYLIKDLFENITLFSNRVLDPTYKKDGDQYIVTFKTSSEKFYSDSLGNETVTPISDYIDIAVFAKPETKKSIGKPMIYQRQKINQKENTFTFMVKEKPYQVGIDPYNYLVDRIPSDNVKKVGEGD